MIPYLKNNLIFRIASADAISKFKNAQAQSFLQVSRKELMFDESSKEAVLLEFDRFSHLIFRVERVLASMEPTQISSSLVKVINHMFLEEFGTIESIISNNPAIFKNRVPNYVSMIHNYTLNLYEAVLSASLSNTTPKGFEKFVHEVNNYLQHFMVCMHEFNNNMIIKSEKAFLCITDFCINISEVKPIEAISLKRAQFFISNGCSPSFILKNYSSKDDIFDTLASSFSEHGIVLIKEEYEECLEAA